MFIFWGGVILLVFIAGLLVQFRIVAGIALRRAIEARNPELEPIAARRAVAEAASRQTHVNSESARHLRATYPASLDQIRLARRVGTLCLFALPTWLIIGRLAGWI